MYVYVYVCMYICIYNAHTWVANCLIAHERVLVFNPRVAQRINNTRVSTYTDRHWSTCIDYLLHDITNPQMTITTTIFKDRPCVSLDLPFCSWRHNWLLITMAVTRSRKMWYLTIDIDLVFGDINGRSSKKYIVVMYEFTNYIKSVSS